MEKLIKFELPDDSEFERLLKEYQTAKNNLHNYLWKEDLKAVQQQNEKAASGN